jgi:hypothetical protein
MTWNVFFFFNRISLPIINAAEKGTDDAVSYVNEQSIIRIRKLLRDQRGNQKLSIKVEETIQGLKEKRQTMMCKTLHRNLMVEQHEPH